MFSKFARISSAFTATMMVVLVTTGTTFDLSARPSANIEAGSGYVMPESQSVTVSSAVTMPSVTRDGYTVKAPPAPPKMEVAASQVKVIDLSTFKNDVTWKIQWPFPVGVPVTSPFGPRTAPCAGCTSKHMGVDLGAGDGSHIQAMTDGVVKVIANEGSDDYGYYAVINYQVRGQDVDVYYGHMQVDSSPLKVGDKVKVGDLVGLVGSTGHSTGPHLHYEVHVDGKVVDPMVWTKANVGNPPTTTP